MLSQQIGPITLPLRGDGVSTSFKFKLGDLFSFDSSDSQLRLVNPNSVPSSVSAVDGNGNTLVASVGSKGIITVTFPDAPPASQVANATANVTLFFDSL